MLSTEVQNIPNRAAEFQAAMKPAARRAAEPNIKQRGCIAAGDRGFFCQYALQYLADAGISEDQVDRGGYLIKTTLDPAVQDAVHNGLTQMANPNLDSIAEVMNIVAPGQDSHKVLAMSSSRTYGLNSARHQTVQPQPFSMIGDGAGSIFKIFTTAAAMEKGLGISANLDDVPPRYDAKGMGNGGLLRLPARHLLREERWQLPLPDDRHPGPGHLAEHGLRQAHPGRRRHPDRRHGRQTRPRAPTPSPAPPDAGRPEPRRHVQEPESRLVHPRPHRSQPARAVQRRRDAMASGGMWCPAPRPSISINDQDGKPIPLTQQACQQVVEPGLAHTLANALLQGRPAGRAPSAASRLAPPAGPSPCPPRPEPPRPASLSAFLGFTSSYAGSAYVYGDNGHTGDICTSPLRSCDDGNVFGGEEPAHAWYLAGMKQVVQATSFDPGAAAARRQIRQRRGQRPEVPNVAGMSEARRHRRAHRRRLPGDPADPAQRRTQRHRRQRHPHRLRRARLHRHALRQRRHRTPAARPRRRPRPTPSAPASPALPQPPLRHPHAAAARHRPRHRHRPGPRKPPSRPLARKRTDGL